MGGSNPQFSAAVAYNRLLGCRTVRSSIRQDRSFTHVHRGLVDRGHTSVQVDSLFLEPGPPGPTPGAREQKAESPQSRYLQPIICITTGVRVGGRGSLVRWQVEGELSERHSWLQHL